MKLGSKIALVVGAAAGYVLGARAGRERYEQISARAGAVWNSKSVVRQRERAAELLDRYVPSFAGSIVKGVWQIAAGLGSLVFGEAATPKRGKRAGKNG